MSSNEGTPNEGSAKEVHCNVLMLELRKYLLLLAILAATVTYAAALNPPGGVWLDTRGGHLTGNQILVVTYHSRYNAFSYSNATAFMASAVVILLLVFGFSDKPHSRNSASLFVVLRTVMVLDLLAIVVAYAAGASRDMLTTVLASLLVSPILGYVLLHAVMSGTFLFKGLQSPADVAEGCSSCRGGDSEKEQEDKRRRKILMLLAIFATTITYTAGLNPPGGFWPDTDTQGQEEQDDRHRAGDPVLQHHHRLRFAFFFICNTISFVASLFVIMLLLTNRFIESLFEAKARAVPYVPMVISLLGLVGAYAAGSCRETDSTAGVLVLYVVGPMLALLCFAWMRHRGNRKVEEEKVNTAQTPTAETKVEDGQQRGLVLSKRKKKQRGLINTAPSLVLLLATLAATVTYQAGLNPPGGFWPDHRDGHKGGDPILFSKHATRYRLFFYCNSTALAASLVVIFMVLTNYLSMRGIKNNGSVPDAHEHKPETRPSTSLLGSMENNSTGRVVTPPVTSSNKKGEGRIGAHVVILEVVMILDLIGLIGAFAAGCCRDVSTSIYVVALAGGALVYVVFHIVFFTLHHDDDLHLELEGVGVGEGDDMEANRSKLLQQMEGKRELLLQMEEKRKRLLLLAILAVTLTYQAGLTPPGGFWLEDVSEVGHHAGDPVLLSNYPGRYTAFFYLNATGFMASVALTILLVNPNLYRAGIKCHALHVCMVAALFGLMGAYAAGSSRHVRTSIYMVALILLVFTFVTVLLLVFKIRPKLIEKWLSKTCVCSEPPKPAVNQQDTEEATGGIRLHTQRRYLMLLGILAASVTYQAGLAPPGGVWPDNNDGHAVGNPILRDSSHRRYHMFFYCNSASFVASVVVITLQLLVNLTTPKEKSCKGNFLVQMVAQCMMKCEAKSLVQTAQCMMVLDLIGLLLAYAAGSTREWETSGSIVLLLVAFFIGIHLLVSYFRKRCGGFCSKATDQVKTDPSVQTV